MTQPESRRKPISHPKPKHSTVRQLYATAFRCGKPECRRPLYRTNDETGEWLLNSRVSHIHARSENGPRWDSQMSAEENRSESNLLPLCSDHAAEIDDTPEHFPPELLREWKKVQVQEYLDLQRSWPLNDEQAEEAAAASFDAHRTGIAGAGAEAVVAAARNTGLMIELARAHRVEAAHAVVAWNAVRDRVNRGMPVFDTDGNRLRVEPSRAEITPLQEALHLALREAEAAQAGQIRLLVGELHAAQAANPALAPWCDWVEAASRDLVRAASRWPSPPGPDDTLLSEATDELKQAAKALAAAGRGEQTPVPPQRPTPSEPEEDADVRAAHLHRKLLEQAAPWGRVTHRPYDPDLYGRLVDAAGTVSGLPELPSLLTIGLDMTARLAARVARNADNSTFLELITQASSQAPLCVAAFLLRQLAMTAEQDGRTDLQRVARDATRRILVAETWQSVEVWEENQANVMPLMAWTADLAGADRIQSTLDTALERDPGLLAPMLAGIAQWSEPIDDGREGAMRGPTSSISSLPVWFPVGRAVALINARMPEVRPGDEDESERYSDRVERHASQALWLAAGNPSAW
ncbi:hypothetical protein [Kitasatospora sp. NPDC002965]|uniref:hypothetical protein n=1 Tax=Kitasatospora sp. NPDC002965 TaxID=3154775 RepID=UPI0033BB2C56